MTFRSLRLGLAFATAIAFIACGDDDDANAGATPTGGDTGATLGIGPGISVTEALRSTLDDPLLVNGFLVAVGGGVAV